MWWDNGGMFKLVDIVECFLGELEDKSPQESEIWKRRRLCRASAQRQHPKWTTGIFFLSSLCELYGIIFIKTVIN